MTGGALPTGPIRSTLMARQEIEAAAALEPIAPSALRIGIGQTAPIGLFPKQH